ncbi:MAG TPA: 50S ribosomal protein L18 [Candidatus Dormibacteraeota bacterium]|nr:50S ribosomal protein L18 [Candidatus Dormibacteraeota bacterium]
MSKLLKLQAASRARRVRAKVAGTAERPRLAARVTARHITAQLINDDAGKTLAHATTVKSEAKGTMTEKAAWVGTQIAVQAKKHKIKKVIFDRGSKLYHGRLHALAEAARKEGLEF